MTPPTWTSGSADPTNQAAEQASPTVADAQDSFQRVLETRVAAFIQDTYGADVLNDYLTAREKDDLAEMLLFEARHGLNIDQIFREQEAAIAAEMEQKLPGSTAAVFGPPAGPIEPDNQTTN